jgi:hypothetical protein
MPAVAVVADGQQPELQQVALAVVAVTYVTMVYLTQVAVVVLHQAVHQ